MKICTNLHRYEHKIVFVIVACLKLFRNNNKNNFAFKCCKFLANLCKSSEILEQCHVKWWLKYQNNKSVSRRLSCKSRIISNINVEPRIPHLQFLTLKSNSKWFALFSHQPELSLQPQTYYWRARIRSLKLLWFETPLATYLWISRLLDYREVYYTS